MIRADDIRDGAWLLILNVGTSHGPLFVYRSTVVPVLRRESWPDGRGGRRVAYTISGDGADYPTLQTAVDALDLRMAG
ncbi:MAG: hypothetical protein GC150_17285 [Rhizobiales bacterium]|nr:hypothetical protein [Hyphomicrobiales bacterium]